MGQPQRRGTVVHPSGSVAVPGGWRGFLGPFSWFRKWPPDVAGVERRAGVGERTRPLQRHSTRHTLYRVFVVFFHVFTAFLQPVSLVFSVVEFCLGAVHANAFCIRQCGAWLLVSF